MTTANAVNGASRCWLVLRRVKKVHMKSLELIFVLRHSTLVTTFDDDTLFSVETKCKDIERHRLFNAHFFLVKQMRQMFVNYIPEICYSTHTTNETATTMCPRTEKKGKDFCLFFQSMRWQSNFGNVCCLTLKCNRRKNEYKIWCYFFVASQGDTKNCLFLRSFLYQK